MVRYLSPVLLLAALAATPSRAQSAPDPRQSPTGQQTSPAASTDSAASATPNDKSKKVWTNDDLKSTGKVSVIGDPKSQKYTMTKPPDPAMIAKYKGNLQELQSQLADVDRQLKIYQDFAEGKPVSDGGEDMSHGRVRTPIDQQTAKLLDKKKQLEAQIDDLYEEARKKGIESGQLK